MCARTFLKSLLVAAGLLLTPLAGCGQTQQPTWEIPEMDARTNNIPLAPVCVGRLRIDLPASARHDWAQSFDESRVYRLPGTIGTSELFWAEVEKRKRELEAQPHDSEGSLLSEFDPVRSNAALLFFRSSAVNIYTYEVERYLWLGDRGYRFEGGIANEEKKSVGHYTSVMDQLSARNDNEEPFAPGFCIDGAVVTGPLPQLVANVDVKVPGWKRVSVVASSNEVNSPPSEALVVEGEDSSVDAELKRIQEVNEIYRPHAAEIETYPKEFDVLRQRDRVVAGLAGREAVWRQGLTNGATLYSFVWHTHDARQGPRGNLGGSVSMDVGDEREPGNEVPPEEDLFALWEAMLASAKVR